MYDEYDHYRNDQPEERICLACSVSGCEHDPE